MSELESLRGEVRAWLAATWHPGRHPDTEWLEFVLDAGYAVPTWPVEWYGRGLEAECAAVIGEEFGHVGAAGARQDLDNLAANTVFAHGTDALKRKVLRPLLTGESTKCLLYSEPGAGSDLASLQTRAERDGDDYVLTGQKVWSSGAQTADYGLTLARTDWDVPKHRGLTYFLLPMNQDGIEVRPIKQITGESHFNEVFLDAARVPAEHVLGAPGEGWRVLQTALAYERANMGKRANTNRSGTLGQTQNETDDPRPAPAPEVDLIALARAAGRANDPVVRQAVTRIHILRTVNRWNAERAKASLTPGGSGSILSLGKLAMSRILHESASVQGLILGAEAQLTGAEHPAGDAAAFAGLNAFLTSIGGGTDEIQRNIVSERVLGLPREPEVDRDVPFREVRTAIVRS